MLVAIEVFHFIGLALLLGGGICNGIILGKAGTSDDVAKSALRSASRRLGQITFVGLLILWGTGVFMVTNIYGGWSAFPTLFWAKMVIVVLLSVSALAAQMFSILAIFSGSRTPRQKVIRLTAITTLLTLLALALAVWTFNEAREEPTADMPAAAPEAAPEAAPAPEAVPEPAPAEPEAEPAEEAPAEVMEEMPAEPTAT